MFDSFALDLLQVPPVYLSVSHVANICHASFTHLAHLHGTFAFLSQIVSLTPAPWSLLFLFLEQPWFYHKRPLILSLLNLTKACNVVSRWCITLGSRKSSVLHHGPSTLRLTLRNSLRNLCQEPLREYNPGTLDWICLHRDSLAQVPPNHAFPNLLVVP